MKPTLLVPALAAAIVLSASVVATADNGRPGANGGHNNNSNSNSGGIVRTEIVKHSVIGSAAGASDSVPCPSNEVATGGGVQVTNVLPIGGKVFVVSTYPTGNVGESATGWTAETAPDTGSTATAYTQTVYAICAELDRGRRHG